MKDITEFLSDELNKSIDNITELKTQIQKMEIDMETSLSYTKNIKSHKDDTMDFFMFESAEDTFRNSEISSLNEEVETMNTKLISYKEQLEKERERLSDIRELLGKYSVGEKDDVFDYSSDTKSNIQALIESADYIYDSVSEFVSEKIANQIGIVSNNNKLIISLVNSDPARALLELNRNNDILDTLSVSLKQFSGKIYRYNPELGFETNFKQFCNQYDERFSYSYNDELNLSSRINDSKCNSYFKLLTCFINYMNAQIDLNKTSDIDLNRGASDDDISSIYDSDLNDAMNNVSRETYKIDFTNYKSKSKLTITLAAKYDFIKAVFSDETSNDKTSNESADIILVKFYLNACNAYLKFKKTNNSFIIEIDNRLY